MVKFSNLDKNIGNVAHSMCLDLYRTFAPLKQSSQTMAMTCLELAVRMNDIPIDGIKSKFGFDYTAWGTSREEVMGKRFASYSTSLTT